MTKFESLLSYKSLGMIIRLLGKFACHYCVYREHLKRIEKIASCFFQRPKRLFWLYANAKCLEMGISFYKMTILTCLDHSQMKMGYICA